MADRYLDAEGDIPEVYYALNILERHFPTSYTSDMGILLTDEPYVMVFRANRRPNKLWLPRDLKLWRGHLENCKDKDGRNKFIQDVAAENSMPGYDPSLEFHIILSLAHEWCHILQKAIFLNLEGTRLDCSFLGEPEEEKAEKWAWKVMSECFSSILKRELASHSRRRWRRKTTDSQLSLVFPESP